MHINSTILHNDVFNMSAVFSQTASDDSPKRGSSLRLVLHRQNAWQQSFDCVSAVAQRSRVSQEMFYRTLWKYDYSSRIKLRYVPTGWCAVIGCKLKQNANEGCNSCASLAGLVLSFIACFILLVIAPLLSFILHNVRVWNSWLWKRVIGNPAGVKSAREEGTEK